MEIIIGIGIFITTVLLIEGGYFAFRVIRRPELKRVKKRLRTLSAGSGNEEIDILRKRTLSEVPWLNRLLLNIPRIHKLDRLLEQANTRYPLGVFILLSILLASLGYIGGSRITTNHLLLIPMAVFLGMMPFLYIYRKKIRRMRKFERQLPDALDLVARALKAGHAFTGGLKMVADELDDPVGTEFDKTLDEINFGVGVPEALKDLANRVDCPDLKFFTISVIIQRETGGNLAEILANISHLIRKRFELQGLVRVLSADGRLSATILIAIPFLIAFYIALINPAYLKPLFADPIGKILVAFAIIMMIFGVLIMKKIINVKV